MRKALEVSIHAPVRGATCASTCQLARGRVSIHAPVRGATSMSKDRTVSFQTFQSTRPCGARRRLQGLRRGSLSVSIHAPVRGATPDAWQLRFGDEVSIHAPVRGATRRGTLQRDMCLCFNPRARAGRDLAFCMRALVKAEFQSTRPCGARRKCFLLPDCIRPVSIHAPVRGATL